MIRLAAPLAAGLALTAAACEASAQGQPSQPPAPQAPQAEEPRQVAPGIVRPPEAVDPGMAKPAPDPKAFPTPVVPPPASSDGQTRGVPK